MSWSGTLWSSESDMALSDPLFSSFYSGEGLSIIEDQLDGSGPMDIKEEAGDMVSNEGTVLNFSQGSNGARLWSMQNESENVSSPDQTSNPKADRMALDEEPSKFNHTRKKSWESPQLIPSLGQKVKKRVDTLEPSQSQIVWNFHPPNSDIFETKNRSTMRRAMKPTPIKTQFEGTSNISHTTPILRVSQHQNYEINEDERIQHEVMLKLQELHQRRIDSSNPPILAHRKYRTNRPQRYNQPGGVQNHQEHFQSGRYLNRGNNPSGSLSSDHAIHYRSSSFPNNRQMMMDNSFGSPNSHPTDRQFSQRSYSNPTTPLHSAPIPPFQRYNPHIATTSLPSTPENFLNKPPFPLSDSGSGGLSAQSNVHYSQSPIEAASLLNRQLSNGPFSSSNSSPSARGHDNNSAKYHSPPKPSLQSNLKIQKLTLSGACEPDSSGLPPCERLLGGPLPERCCLEDFDIFNIFRYDTLGRSRLVRLKEDNKFYTMKVVHKSTVFKHQQVSHVITEKKIGLQKKSCWIVKLYKTMNDSNSLFFFYEFIPGGDLFNLIQLLGRLSVPVAKFFIAEIIVALEVLHDWGIVYRNLRPENVFIDSHGHIKLGELLYSKESSNPLYTICGSPEYIAPEVLLGEGYGESVDWWSLGILFFELVAGYTPFSSRNPLKLCENIISGNFTFPDFFDAGLRDVISRLLCVNPKNRLGNLKEGVRGLEQSDWFTVHQPVVDWEAIKSRSIEPPLVLGCFTPFDHYPLGQEFANKDEMRSTEQIDDLFPLEDVNIPNEVEFVLNNF